MKRFKSAAEKFGFIRVNVRWKKSFTAHGMAIIDVSQTKKPFFLLSSLLLFRHERVSILICNDGALQSAS